MHLRFHWLIYNLNILDFICYSELVSSPRPGYTDVGEYTVDVQEDAPMLT
jgi:hypothetical protein